MKIILILISFILISCEQGDSSAGQAEINRQMGDQPQFETIGDLGETVSVPLVQGFYESGCVDYQGERVEFYLNIKAYEVELTMKEGVNNNCEGLKDQTIAHFDINGDFLEYTETTFFYFADGGGSYPCDQTHMKSGNTYSIDGLGCDESFESRSVDVSQNEQGFYVINGVVFDE